MAEEKKYIYKKVDIDNPKWKSKERKVKTEKEVFQEEHDALRKPNPTTKRWKKVSKDTID